MNTQSLTRNRSLKLLLCYLLSLKCCGASDSISCEQRIDNAAGLHREEATEQQQKQEAIRKRDEVIQGQDQRLKKATEVVKRLMNEKAKLETDLKNEEGRNQNEFKACLKELGDTTANLNKGVEQFGVSAEVMGQASRNVNTAAENMTNAVNELKENKEEFRECAVIFQKTAESMLNSNEQQLSALTSAINNLADSQKKLADAQQKQVRLDYWTGKFMQKPDNNLPVPPQIPYAANQESGQSSDKSRRVTSYPKQKNISVGNRDVQGLLYPKRVNLINSGALVRNPDYVGPPSSTWDSEQSSVMNSKKSPKATITVNQPYVEELSSSTLHEAEGILDKHEPIIETPGSSSKTESSTSTLPSGSPFKGNRIRKTKVSSYRSSGDGKVVERSPICFKGKTTQRMDKEDLTRRMRRILYEAGLKEDGMWVSFKDLSELRKVFAQLEDENSMLELDKMMLEEQVTELQDKLNEVSRQSKQRMDSNEDLRSLNADLSNQLENGKKEISRLREENRKLTIEKQSADERAQSLQKKLESYEGKVNRLNRKVSDYKFSFEQLQNATQDLNKKYRERKKELKEKTEEVFSLKMKISQLETLLMSNGLKI